MSAFPCTCCGLCCRMVGTILRGARISHIRQIRDAAARFPYDVRPDGSCSMLEGRKCKVYETRPDLCNLATMAKLAGMDEGEYFRLNAMVCNLMIELEGMGEEWKVNL